MDWGEYLAFYVNGFQKSLDRKSQGPKGQNLERRGPMTRVTFLICLVATATVVAVLPALGQLEDGPWPMFHHDLQHTGRSP